MAKEKKVPKDELTKEDLLELVNKFYGKPGVSIRVCVNVPVDIGGEGQSTRCLIDGTWYNPPPKCPYVWYCGNNHPNVCGENKTLCRVAGCSKPNRH